MKQPNQDLDLDQTRYSIRDDVLSRQLPDDQLVILNTRTEKYFDLNELGSKTWECLTAGTSLNELAEQFGGEYQVPAESVAQDISEFLADLVANDLIELVPVEH